MQHVPMQNQTLANKHCEWPKILGKFSADISGERFCTELLSAINARPQFHRRAGFTPAHISRGDERS